ncbi:MAG TPA: caspase family protein [Myxococcaceae bacterium]|nr:caspase family protein [Myxococcaceae bacterium]
MASRKALLIGAEEYGAGFPPLPAVKQDIKLMDQALRLRGFEVQPVEKAVASNASNLEQTIRKFVEDAGPGDVRIVYFSGHGLRLDGRDWIVPEGVSRDEALNADAQRVGTDLSNLVERSRVDLVLFFVDACRDERDRLTEKSGEWAKRALPPHRFIRMFGCDRDNVCRVLKGHEGADVSLFTKALATELGPEGRSETIMELLAKIVERCSDLAAAANPRLPPQKPCLDLDRDIESETYGQLRSMKIFPRGPAAALPRGARFDQAKLHCVVVTSERSQFQNPGHSLSEYVKCAFDLHGPRVWRAFRKYWHGRQLADGTERSLSEGFAASLVVRRDLPVMEAFRTQEAFDDAIWAVAQADLAFFDVSSFEPGVLLLMGVRAAVRRGVTVLSHGMEWTEDKPLKVPFNLQDLQVASHSRPPVHNPEDLIAERLVERVERGFEACAHLLRYLDLPAYDGLRDLGPGARSAETIPPNKLVLMLCPYQGEYDDSRQFVKNGIRAALREKNVEAPNVLRLIDIASPQLVSQLLYQYLRRASACVVDWSGLNPSVFLELGIRLAVSPRGAAQIIDERFSVGDPPGQGLQQVGLMRERLRPSSYTLRGPGQVFDDVVASLMSRDPYADKEPEYGRVYRLVSDAIDPITPKYISTHEELQAIADSLHAAEQEQLGSNQSVHDGPHLKRDRERAALERRLAAWLYLEHRLQAGSRTEDDPLRVLHQKLGRQVAGGLYQSDAPGDIELALKIDAARTK